MATPAAPAASDPPLPPAVLRRLALRMGRNTPAAGIGPHLRRRQGHSLEFREYRPYSPGEDIRAVDWRASARHGVRHEWIARSHEAEQRLTLAILIDNRPEMMLPAGAPKLLFALWVARALTALALDDGNEVLLARLFDGPGAASLSPRGASAQGQAREFAERLLQGAQGARAADSPHRPFADLATLGRQLRPASAVVIVSDMLFDDPEGAFVRFARKAQERRRSLSIVQLDSIGHETAILREAREFHLLRPGVTAGDELFTFEDAPFAAAHRAAATHLEAMRGAIARGGLDWPRQPLTWPEAPVDARTEAEQDLLSTLFARRFPRLPLIAGLGFGTRT